MAAEHEWSSYRQGQHDTWSAWIYKRGRAPVHIAQRESDDSQALMWCALCGHSWEHADPCNCGGVAMVPFVDQALAAATYRIGGQPAMFALEQAEMWDRVVIKNLGLPCTK